MSEQSRFLIVEDRPADAELEERELRAAGLVFTSRRVETEAQFRDAVHEFAPHLIISDYSLPGSDGTAFLRLARELCPDVPFIFVSGAIGEERAIETLKEGATDYVLKSRLGRLIPSVRRALAEADERASRRRAETALRCSEERHRALLRINNAIIGNLDREALFAAIAEAVAEVVPFDRLSIALHDRERDVLHVSAVRGRLWPQGFGALGSDVPRAGSHIGYVFDEKRPLVRQDLQHERQFSTEAVLLEQGIRAYVVAPLIGNTRVVGTINVGSVTPDRYGPGEADLLHDMARQIALAVENMQAYDEIARLKAQLERENSYLQDEIATQHNFREIIGRSAALQRALKAVETVAPTDATVLLTGETGTGKELVARAIHDLSPQRGKALVKVNCAALPATLIESELFGHEKGAFTGALGRVVGRFELAHRGTIFLDEIGDLPLELQAKLLRVLQEGEFERVGSGETMEVKVRVVAATNRELEAAVREGTFRADLYYRLNVFPIEMPPLRERREDIPDLVHHFVRKYQSRLGRRIETIPQAAMTTLQEYHWPGNVRELENIIERAVILSRGPKLELGEWLHTPVASPTTPPERLADVQRVHILSVLDSVGWRISGERGAAKVLGVRPTTLEARMKKLGIRRAEQGPSSNLPPDTFIERKV